MNRSILNPVRKSRMEMDHVYYWTYTVKDWKHLFKQDKYKQLIINILREQVEKKQIAIYGFVIMPNHIHLLWELLLMNGKEKPNASFNKSTSHIILNDLKLLHPAVLPYFKVDEPKREYRIWQEDPLAVLMDSKEKFLQKLDYIHNNPLQDKWNLAKRPEEYLWSSADFYESGIDKFGILSHYRERFG